MNERWGIGAVVVIILLLILLFTTVHIVPPGHRGVRVTLGSVAPEALEEGLQFKWPLGIAKIEDITIQQRTAQGDAACFSRDLQTVNVRFAVLYRIPETKVVELYQQYRGDPYDSLVEPRLQEALKQVTATYPAEELVQKREQAREAAIARVKLAVGEMVNIVDINILNIDLTKELEKAIEQKMVQQQQALAKSFELEREKKQAEITLVQAKAEAESVKIKGEALASSPKVIDLEVVKKWDGRAPQTVVIGGGTGDTSGASIILPVNVGKETRNER